MWTLVAAGLTLILAGLFVMRGRRSGTSRSADREAQRADHEHVPGRIASRSILSRTTVERTVATGAPPTPWMLRREDRDAIEAIRAYFACAIPNPTAEGRPYIEDSVGYGGPQLELKVPIISSRRSVAVVFRSWDSNRNTLESNLFFNGTVNDRLAAIVKSAGFEQMAYNDGVSTVFRSGRGGARQQSA